MAVDLPKDRERHEDQEGRHGVGNPGGSVGVGGRRIGRETLACPVHAIAHCCFLVLPLPPQTAPSASWEYNTESVPQGGGDGGAARCPGSPVLWDFCQSTCIQCRSVLKQSRIRRWRGLKIGHFLSCQNGKVFEE